MYGSLSAHFLREAVIGSGRQAGRNPWCSHGIRPPARPPSWQRRLPRCPQLRPGARGWRFAIPPVKLREQWSPAKARAVSLVGVQVGKKARRAALQKPSLAGPAVSNSIAALSFSTSAPHSSHRHRRLADRARVEPHLDARPTATESASMSSALRIRSSYGFLLRLGNLTRARWFSRA